jgi:hypothetical protein
MQILTRSTEQSPSLGRRRTVGALLSFDRAELALVVRNTQRFSSGGRSFLILGTFNRFCCTSFLDFVFAGFDLTPRERGDVVVVESGNEILPFGDGRDRVVEDFTSSVEHIVVNRFEESRESGVEVGDGKSSLGAGVSSY